MARFMDPWPTYKQGSYPSFHTYANPNLYIKQISPQHDNITNSII
jgi:hypothetical protein